MRTMTLKGEVKKQWYDTDIHEARKKRRQLERKYRKTKLEIHRQMFKDQSQAVVALINQSKTVFFQQKLESANSKDTFKLVKGLLQPNMEAALPSSSSDQALADNFVTYFRDKVQTIRNGLDEQNQTPHHDNEAMTTQAPALSCFMQQTADSLAKIIQGCAPKSCSLDPMPTTLMKNEHVLDAVIPSLTALINKSLADGKVPQCWKQAQVTPLLKKSGLDINDYKNYRPVSNIPFISKVIEKVVAKQLTNHLRQHNLHDHLQSAYKQGCSTESALIKIKADMDMMIDQGDGILLVLLDLSAAFDTIDHRILLDRLQHHVGITGVALDWVQSYLTDRRQAVHIGSSISCQVPLSIGVPQGSVLGPLLFLIYILPLGKIIEGHNIKRHGFADDSQLYCRLPLKDFQASLHEVRKMEECLAEVRDWMLQNKLKLNDSKTECMILTSKWNNKHPIKRTSMCIGDETILPAECVRNLGAFLDHNLTMERQINSVVRSVYYHLRGISRIRRHLNTSACARVIHACVTSRLDFHNGLLAGIADKHLSRLQVAQNNAARLLTGTRKSDHITPVLIQLHWLPVRERIAYKILTTIHSALHSPNAPSYLQECFIIYKPARNLRSSTDCWNVVTPKNSGSYGARSYTVLGARLWNSLPADLRGTLSKLSFKKQLKTFLFRKAFY